MVKIDTFVDVGRLTPPTQYVSLPASHFTEDEQDLIKDFTRHNGIVVLNTNAGWWNFLVRQASDFRFEFQSTGEPRVSP